MIRWSTKGRRWSAALPLVIVLAVYGPTATRDQGLAPEEEHAGTSPYGSASRVSVGEAATYSVAIGRFKLGEANLSLDGAEMVGSHEVVRSTLKVEGGPPFFRVEVYLSSLFEPASMRSHHLERKIREGPKRYRDRYVLDQENRSYTAERWSEDLVAFQPSTVETSGAMPADAIDEISFLYLVRTLPLEVGEEYRLMRYFKPRSNPIVVRVLKREEIRVPAGRFRTIVVEPIVPEIGIFQAKRKPRVWVTDDERRLIVKIQSSAAVGPVALNLTDYVPADASGEMP